MEEQLSTLENNFLNIQGQYYSLPLIHDAVSANVINFDELTIESTSADLNSPDDMSVKILETDMLISENMAVFSSNTKSIMSCMQTVKAQLLLLNDQQHQIQRLFHKKKWIQERRELTLYYFNFFIKRYPFIPSGFEKSVVTTANRVDMAHEFFKILRKRFIPFLLPAVNDQDRHSFEALATDAFRIEERIASVFGSMPEQYKKMCYQQFHMMGRVWPINAPFPFVKIEQDGGDGIQLPFLFSNLQPSDNKEKYKSQKITPPRSLAKSESGKKENWRKFRNKPRLSS